MIDLADASRIAESRIGDAPAKLADELHRAVGETEPQGHQGVGFVADGREAQVGLGGIGEGSDRRALCALLGLPGVHTQPMSSLRTASAIAQPAGSPETVTWTSPGVAVFGPSCLDQSAEGPENEIGKLGAWGGLAASVGSGAVAMVATSWLVAPLKSGLGVRFVNPVIPDGHRHGGTDREAGDRIQVQVRTAWVGRIE